MSLFKFIEACLNSEDRTSSYIYLFININLSKNISLHLKKVIYLHSMKSQHKLSFVRDSFECQICLKQQNYLTIRATHVVDQFYLKGQFSFDTMPTFLKELQNMNEIYTLIKQCKQSSQKEVDINLFQKKNHNNLKINHETKSLELTIFLTQTCKKIVPLPLNKFVLSAQEVLRREINKLRIELKEKKNESQSMRYSFQNQREEKIKIEKMLIKSKAERSNSCCKGNQTFWFILILVVIVLGGWFFVGNTDGIKTYLQR